MCVCVCVYLYVFACDAACSITNRNSMDLEMDCIIDKKKENQGNFRGNCKKRSSDC